MSLYLVIHRGRTLLKTDSIKEARTKLESCGSSAYIQYTREAIIREAIKRWEKDSD